MMVLMGMELPIAAIRQQIASGIDVIVHLGRLPDKSRRVLEIMEITGMEEGQIILSPLYRIKEEGGNWKLVQTGRLQKRQKLVMAGIVLPEYFGEKGEGDGVSNVSSVC